MSLDSGDTGFFNAISINSKVPQKVFNLQNQVEQILKSAEHNLTEESLAVLGLDFNLDSPAGSSRIEIDISDFVSSLRVNFSELKASILGTTEDAREGFVRQLLDVVNQFTVGLRAQYGSSGFLAGLHA